ncbi:MAG: hypothetical protein HWN67_23075 [Candidatus Helarchaeota archaeon]|nr:hypothetical protein [Candidatus Helarchaeota archaeon]
MKKIDIFFQKLTFIILLIVFNLIGIFSSRVYGQTDDILKYRADVFTSEVINGQTIRKLVGNVVLYQKNYTLKSDLGTFLQETDRFIFEGNVQFDDGMKKLISDKVVYDNNERIFYFDEGIKLIKDKKILTADRGIYYRDENRSYCEGNVKYVDSVQTFTCEKAEFFEESENINAYDNLVFNNFNENITITGGKGNYFGKEDFIEVSEKPVMILKEKNTEMTVSGEKLEFFNKLSKVIASRNVEISRENLKARCNIAEYIMKNGEEKIILKENPTIVQDGSDIKGEQIELFLKDRNIYKLDVIEDAVATMSADTLGYNNELKGKNIYIFLRENKIEKMVAERNAESIYYLFEDGESKGANTVSGERITLYFTDENIERVIVDGGGEGIFYPSHLVREPKK